MDSHSTDSSRFWEPIKHLLYGFLMAVLLALLVVLAFAASLIGYTIWTAVTSH
jgi:hypothetical protein